MVTGLLLRPRPSVDAGARETVSRFRRTKEVVDAEARVPLPAAGRIVPEGIEPVVVRMERAKRVGPALVHDPAPSRPGFRLNERVIGCRPDGEDVAIFRNDMKGILVSNGM